MSIFALKNTMKEDNRWKYALCGVCGEPAKTATIMTTPSFPPKWVEQVAYFCDKHHPFKILKKIK